MLLAAAVCTGFASGAAPAPDPSVVLVMGAEMCSGFYVAPNVLVTAAHCLGPLGPAGRLTWGQRSAMSVSTPACGWATDIRCDWAVVGFSGPPAPATKALLASEPRYGDVELTGYPWTSGGQVQETLKGMVYYTSARYSDTVFYTNVGIQGYSGGPVVRDGKVVAVHNRLVLPWLLDAQSGAGAAVTDEMLRAVAAVPPPLPVVRRAVLPMVSR